MSMKKMTYANGGVYSLLVNILLILFIISEFSWNLETLIIALGSSGISLGLNIYFLLKARQKKLNILTILAHVLLVVILLILFIGKM